MSNISFERRKKQFHSDNFHYYSNPYFLVDNIRCPNKSYVLTQNKKSNVRYPSFISDNFGNYIKDAMNTRRYNMNGDNLTRSSPYHSYKLQQIPHESFLESIDRIFHASILDNDNDDGLRYQLVGRLRIEERESTHFFVYFALHAKQWELPIQYSHMNDVDEGIEDANPRSTSFIVLGEDGHTFLSEFIGPGISIHNWDAPTDRVTPRNDLERCHIISLWARDSLLYDRKSDLHATYPMIVMYGLMNNRGIEEEGNFGKEVIRIIFKPIFERIYRSIPIFDLDNSENSKITDSVRAQRIREIISDNIDVVYHCNFIEEDDDNDVKLELFGRAKEDYPRLSKLYFMLHNVIKDNDSNGYELLISSDIANLMNVIDMNNHLKPESMRRLILFIDDTDGEYALNNLSVSH